MHEHSGPGRSTGAFPEIRHEESQTDGDKLPSCCLSPFYRMTFCVTRPRESCARESAAGTTCSEENQPTTIPLKIWICIVSSYMVQVHIGSIDISNRLQHKIKMKTRRIYIYTKFYMVLPRSEIIANNDKELNCMTCQATLLVPA